MFTVWSYKKLKELNDQLGYVECEDKLALKLIASGDAQDPKIGADHFKHIDNSPRKVVKPKPKPKPKTPKKDIDESIKQD